MSNEDTLLAWLHEGKLQLQSKMPNDPPAQLFYYIKDDSSRDITMTNIHNSVISGIAQGDVMQSFLQQMSTVFLPMCNANGTWPSSIKK